MKHLRKVRETRCRGCLAIVVLCLGGCGSAAKGPPADNGTVAMPATPVEAAAASEGERVDDKGPLVDDFWKGLERHEIQLDQTLLLVKGSRGIVACPYLNVAMFARTNEACAIVPARNIDGMLESKVTAVTPKAQELGIVVGMSGREALDKIR